MLDLKLIHHAIALAQHRNFARTAEWLGISQPTLSRNIANLEASLGVRLFDRRTDGLEPTEFGKLLVLQGQELVQSADDLEREIKLLQGLEIGELVVGAGPYALEISVGSALARLLGKYPGLSIEVEGLDWRSIPQYVLAGKLDIGVVELTSLEEDPRLETEKLPAHKGVLYCRGGHPLLEKSAPALEEVFAYPYVGTRLAPRFAAAFMRMVSTGHIDKNTGDYVPPITLSSIRAACDVVMNSDAISAASRRQIADELADGRLGVVGFHPPWLVSNYGFVYLRNRSLSPAALAFMAEMRAVEAEIAAAEAGS